VKRSFRLTRSTEIKRVRSNGKSYAHPLVVLVVTPSAEEAIHVGITAGRNVGGAVERNRAKRLLREAFRAWLPQIATGWDMIAIARAGLPEKSLNEIERALENLLRRAHLIKPDDEHESQSRQ
jgi:ribonuclease P protein component